MTPGAVLDANAGHLLANRDLNDKQFSHYLKLPRDRVMVVPRGTPADPAILLAARDLGTRVITNDRFRDWVDKFREMTEPGHLTTGGARNGEACPEISA